MKVNYNGLQVKRNEEKNKDVFSKLLGGKIRNAKAEMRVCPVCGSENVEICSKSNDYIDEYAINYYLDGRCCDCQSRFQSDDLFCLLCVDYDKDRKEYRFSDREICDIEAENRKNGTLAVVCIVLLVISVVACVGKWGMVTMVMCGLSALGVTLYGADWMIGRGDLKKAFESEEKGKNKVSQLKKENIPFFTRGFSAEDDCVLDYLNTVPDWSDV